MSQKRPGAVHGQWAEFRFGIIGGLLSAPPPRGKLDEEIEALACKTWTHPSSGEPTQFHASTIARWYYAALARPSDVVGAVVKHLTAGKAGHASRDRQLSGGKG
jgi:putative transposase